MSTATRLALIWALAMSTEGVVPQSTFRSSVNTVPVFVTAVRSNGALVGDLAADDFEVRDNGVKQFVNVFESGQQAITIAILMDESASMRAIQSTTTSAAAAFIRELGPADRATVGVFSRSVRIHGDLTSEHDRLNAWLAVRSPVMAGTALWDAVNAGMSALEGETRRRVVLVLTDGDDNSSEVDPREVVMHATRDGVMVYAVSIRSSDSRPSRPLRDLSVATGGAFIDLQNHESLVTVFRRVADELHNQYLLGFSPSSLDGRTHSLTVKAKRRGVSVRARSSYYADAGGSF